MDYLTKLVDALRSLGLLHGDIEKVSRSIDSASADYHAEKERSRSQQPVILGELRRPQAEIDAEGSRESRKETRASRHETRDARRLWFEGAGLAIASILAVANVGLWIVTYMGAKAARVSAQASESAAYTAHSALVRSNRPWIGQSAQPYFTDKPIVTVNSVTSAGVAFEIHNYGTSPALHVNMDVIPDILAPPKSPETFFEQSDKDIEIACRMADTKTQETQGFAYAGGRQAQIKNPAGGQTIFPSGSVRFLWPINLQMGQQTTTGHGLDLFGCIAYRDQFDEVVHHTKFCYMTAERVTDVKAGEGPQPCGINQNAD